MREAPYRAWGQAADASSRTTPGCRWRAWSCSPQRRRRGPASTWGTDHSCVEPRGSARRGPARLQPARRLGRRRWCAGRCFRGSTERRSARIGGARLERGHPDLRWTAWVRRHIPGSIRTPGRWPLRGPSSRSRIRKEWAMRGSYRGHAIGRSARTGRRHACNELSVPPGTQGARRDLVNRVPLSPIHATVPIGP